MAPDKTETGRETKTWTSIHIERMDAHKYHWVYLTNDDNMDGFPDGRIAVTQGFGDLPGLRAMFGKSRMVDGRPTEVYVDGVKEE